MIIVQEKSLDRKEFLVKLYKEAFPSVADFVHKNGGSLDDARDVFQEAVIVYYEKLITDPDLEHRRGYLFGIARHMWFKKLRNESPNRFTDLKELEDFEAQGNDQNLSAQKILDFLTHTGKRCMEILKSFYYDNLSMKQLSDQFNFTSERSATVQKYKCLEKVRDHVKSKSMTYEDFLE